MTIYNIDINTLIIHIIKNSTYFTFMQLHRNNYKNVYDAVIVFVVEIWGRNS